jgi:hypothetical protein
MTTVIDRLTLSTVPLEQYFNDTRLGQGTGFMWRAGARDYLVTNWLVLSNRNLFTGKNLSANGGRPNRLRAVFNVKTGFFDRHQLQFKIWDDDDRPLWLVHPTRHVDIAVLPIEVVARPINSPNTPIQLPLYPINELPTRDSALALGWRFSSLDIHSKSNSPAIRYGSVGALHQSLSLPPLRQHSDPL